MKPPTVAESLMDEQAYCAQLGDYDAWMQSGRAMLASADLIWPKVQVLFARTSARAAAVRKAFETGGLPMSQAVGRTLPTLGLEDLQEMLGYHTREVHCDERSRCIVAGSRASGSSERTAAIHRG